MKMLLSADTTVNEINRRFSTEFPHLKLVFYTTGKDHRRVKYEAAGHATMQEISSRFRPGSILLFPGDPVVSAERRIRQWSGLEVQVLRRAGGMWTEISQTGDLTLGNQNAMGATASRPFAFNIHTLFL